MRRAEVRKIGEQVLVRPYLILRHLSICKERKEEIDDVVCECPAIARVDCRPRGVGVEDVWQQGPCDPRCFGWRVSTGVFQRMRENGDETGVVRRLPSEIGGVLFAGEERSLIRSCTAIRLNPFSTCAVERTSPQAHLPTPEGRIGHFQYDTAHVLVGEVIVTGELQVVQGSLDVEEKRISAPAGEEAVVAGFSHLCFPLQRNRRAFDDNLTVIACTGGSRTFNTAQRRCWIF